MNNPCNNSQQPKCSKLGKHLLQIVALLLVVLVFASCAKQDNKGKKPFKVAMECGYAPFNWTQLDKSNGAVPIEGTNEFANGYDVQIAKRVAESLDRDLVIVKSTWSGLIPGLNSGQTDAIIAGMSATEERRKAIDFSDPYYMSDLVVVIKKNGPYAEAKSLNDFKNAKITGQLGTLHYDVIDQIDDVQKQKALEDFPNMIVALQAGTIDGYISERPGALSAVMANGDLMFVDFPEGQGFIFDASEVTIGIGLKTGNPLQGEINSALSKISPEEREEIMQDAIRNQPGSAQQEGFWQAVSSILKRYWPHFLRGAATTLFIALTGTVMGLLIGLLVATFRITPLSKKSKPRRGIHKFINFLLTAYVEVIRGTPMMVQAIVFFYGYTVVTGRKMAPLVASLLIVSFNTGAYMTEVVRGGIESVDKGQFEATKAIGMTHGQSMRSVILPQAIRNILPATGNEFVINIKDTSVLNVISVTELFYATKDVQANTLRMFETFLITAVIYFILTFTVTRILYAIERKMDGPDHYMLTSSSMPSNIKVHQDQEQGR